MKTSQNICLRKILKIYYDHQNVQKHGCTNMATVIQNGRQGWLGHACNDKKTDAPPVIAPMFGQKKKEEKT